MEALLDPGEMVRKLLALCGKRRFEQIRPASWEGVTEREREGRERERGRRQPSGLTVSEMHRVRFSKSGLWKKILEGEDRRRILSGSDRCEVLLHRPGAVFLFSSLPISSGSGRRTTLDGATSRTDWPENSCFRRGGFGIGGCARWREDKVIVLRCER